MWRQTPIASHSFIGSFKILVFHLFCRFITPQQMKGDDGGGPRASCLRVSESAIRDTEADNITIKQQQ